MNLLAHLAGGAYTAHINSHIPTHSTADLPPAYTHYNFFSVPLQQIFQQLPYSEFMHYVPVNHNPQILLVY